MNQDEREAFFADQVASGDFETTIRHRGKMMTAQYINECVLKHNGMEVADQDGTVWGWVYDCHKSIGRWVAAPTHDDRVEFMAGGLGWKELKSKYEPYWFAIDSSPTHSDPAEPTEPPVPTSDPVNPNHYRSHPSGVECIQITEHMNFNLGNTIKYVWRAGLKTDDPVEDIKKALWYLNRELSRIEGES